MKTVTVLRKYSSENFVKAYEDQNVSEDIENLVLRKV